MQAKRQRVAHDVADRILLFHILCCFELFSAHSWAECLGDTHGIVFEDVQEIEQKDNTSTTFATYDMPQHVLNVALPENDIQCIEYIMVMEPEYMVVFQEKGISASARVMYRSNCRQ